MMIGKILRNSLVNVRMLMRIAGWLLLIESFFMLFPTITCVVYNETDWMPFGATAALTALCGLILATRSHPTSHHMGKRDGYLLTAMVWVIFSVFGLIPFLFCSNPLNVTDAFFEAMSAFTTTGATVLPSFAGLSHGMHLWRAIMQWIGGMGIILFTLAVIPMLNHSGGMQMFNAEVTGITHDKIRPRISQTAKSLWLIYFSLTVVLVLLLWAGPMDLFTSICHAFGTISTGGYSTGENGICAWENSVYVKVVLTVFMFLGGVNFALIYKCARGNYHALRANDVFRAYLYIIAVMLVLFALSIQWNEPWKGWQQLTLDPLFQVVSVLTSTGFALSTFEQWGPMAIALTFVMMFFGACAGSTSGGAKIDRILYLFRHSRNEIYRCLYPNAIHSVKINDKVASPELVSKVIAFLCIYMLLVVGGGIALAACGVPVVDAFFSAFFCISNTGLGAGITGYGMSFDIIPDLGKWILSFLMLTGRLEIFTILVLFLPSFWRR